jgi:hypothetical protein
MREQTEFLAQHGFDESRSQSLVAHKGNISKSPNNHQKYILNAIGVKDLLDSSEIARACQA